MKKYYNIKVLKYHDKYRDTLVVYRDISLYIIFGDTHPYHGGLRFSREKIMELEFSRKMEPGVLTARLSLTGLAE